MANLLINGEEYEEYAFESESEFEKAVIENSKFLFGPEMIYIDVKRRMGDSNSYNKGIPDGYVIDFSNVTSPQLYFVENELSSHDIYSHISEQLLRFTSLIKRSKSNIRNILLDEIKKDKQLFNKISEKIKNSKFDNIDHLMVELTEKNTIKIVLVIDNAEEDLTDILGGFKDQPDTILLQRYIKNNKPAYYYEPLRQIPQQTTRKAVQKIKPEGEEFDTVVCAAFEEGFKSAYEQKNAWWAIRLSQLAREKLKYLAIYEKSPVMAIRNVAEIDRIEPFEDSGKFIVYLKNKQLISPIKFDKPGSTPQSPRFTTYKRLLSAKFLSKLWEYWV
jgi:hypothetical protein